MKKKEKKAIRIPDMRHDENITVLRVALATAIQTAIDEMTENAVELFRLAAEVDRTTVVEVAETFTDLRRARRQLLSLELAENEDRFQALARRATNEAEALKTTIRTLNDIVEVIRIADVIVGIIARI